MKIQSRDKLQILNLEKFLHLWGKNFKSFFVGLILMSLGTILINSIHTRAPFGTVWNRKKEWIITHEIRWVRTYPINISSLGSRYCKRLDQRPAQELWFSDGFIIQIFHLCVSVKMQESCMSEQFTSGGLQCWEREKNLNEQNVTNTEEKFAVLENKYINLFSPYK